VAPRPRLNTETQSNPDHAHLPPMCGRARRRFLGVPHPAIPGWEIHNRQRPTQQTTGLHNPHDPLERRPAYPPTPPQRDRAHTPGGLLKGPHRATQSPHQRVEQLLCSGRGPSHLCTHGCPAVRHTSSMGTPPTSQQIRALGAQHRLAPSQRGINLRHQRGAHPEATRHHIDQKTHEDRGLTESV
jgi:hypothetical protein